MEQKLEKKYIPLANYFKSAKQTVLQLSFTELENILGQKLPNASYLNKSWWLKSKSPLKYFTAWTENDYFVANVLPGYYVTFKRTTPFTDQTIDDDHPYNIRQAEADDASELFVFQRALQTQTTFTIQNFINAHPTVQHLHKSLVEYKKTEHTLLLVAIVDGYIGGFVLIKNNQTAHLKHRAAISINILNQYKHLDLVPSFIEKAEQWAHQKNIQRLDVSLCTRSEEMVDMYEQNGFTKEGTHQKAFLIDDVFYDEMTLGKILS